MEASSQRSTVDWRGGGQPLTVGIYNLQVAPVFAPNPPTGGTGGTGGGLGLQARTQCIISIILCSSLCHLQVILVRGDKEAWEEAPRVSQEGLFSSYPTPN